MQLPLAIERLDLAAEIGRVIAKDGLGAELAREAESQYRQFLALSLEHPESLTPSKLIDTVWHQHMADTRKYIADCIEIFGDVLHHDPKVTGQLMERQFAVTCQLFKHAFEVDISKPLHGTPEACGNDRGRPAACGSVRNSPAACGSVKAA